MKVLLLNQAFYPDVVATGQYLRELGEALVSRGHEITVVTGRRGYDDPNIRFPKRERWHGMEIYRIGTLGLGKKNRWRRGMDFASFIASSCFRLATLPRHDVIVGLTSPPLISFIGACLALVWRCRFCYWVMDLNPDAALAAGWLRAGTLVTRLLERLSRFSLDQSGKVIALDRFMRDRIVAKGIRPDKIVVIPPWTQDNDVTFDAEGRQKFRAAHGLDGKFVVMHSGNHSPCHPLNTLLEAAIRLREAQNVTFCFVGGGSERERVQQWADRHKLGNILCLPYQPLSQLAPMLSAADMHIVVMGSPFVGIVHPCKVYNLLRISTPILCIGPNTSHVSEIFEGIADPGRYMLADHGHVDRVAEQILSVRDRPKCKRHDSTDSFARNFSKNVLLPRLIEQIVGESGESENQKQKAISGKREAVSGRRPALRSSNQVG